MGRARVQWLELGGTEVGNAVRTLTYIRRGLLGHSGFKVTLAQDFQSEEDCGYSDSYSSSYEGPCPFDPQNLACYCGVISETAYGSPRDDPAPWFDSSRGESAQFMGFIPTDIDIGPVLSRNTRQRGTGGGLVGRQRPRMRSIGVSGTLFASTGQGLAWGERWLTEILAGSDAGCGPDIARLLPSCPEEPDTDRFFRELHRAAVIDGPNFERLDGITGCYASEVDFQIAVGSEWLRAPTEECQAARPLHVPGGTAGDSILCKLSGPPLVGDAASIITLWAGDPGSSLRDVTIATAPLPSGSCPSSEADDFTFTVDYVPRGGRIEIDAADRQVRIYDADGDFFGSFDRLTWSGSWQWITTEHDTDRCITIDATSASINPGSMVEVLSTDVEL